LVVLTSYDQGDTKTGAERWMPLHPVLAAMLAEWRMRGWSDQQGRAPSLDDLVVPHSKPENRGRRVVFGGMRSDHDSYKRLRLDLEALGLRRRRFHDLRRAFITLAREDGAEKDILHLCMHGAPGQDVMELYTSFGWATLCKQVAALQMRRAKPAADKGPTRRYHESLLAAFVSGASIGEAARQAGVSERTARRWKAGHGTEVLAARRALLDGLLTKVRAALPVALERLESIAKNSEDEGVAVRASLGLWDIFGRVSDRMELEQRIAALENPTKQSNGGLQ
jgi:hypothetical protein